MNDSIYISVTDLNNLIKRKIDSDPSLNDVFLKGELSNVKMYPSGHLYFAIKDSQSIIKAVMWASYIPRLSFTPKDGDEVIVHGKISVYPSRGEYQIYVDAMSNSGAGDELRKLKELTEKLRKEGLFDDFRKRSLPKYPSKVGLITARGSAAIEDMKVNLLARWPLVEIEVFPSLVQGKDAPKDLLEAFKKSQEANVDVLIIGRGGGSSEDLGAFNDEALVRALSTSKCPTISAVGHEIDVTLTDLVADKRVSTPTGAAMAAVPDKNEVRQDLDNLFERLLGSTQRTLLNIRKDVESLTNNPFLTKPSTIYENKINDLNNLGKLLNQAIYRSVLIKKEAVKGLIGRMSALSPDSVINRGYSITTDGEGNVIKNIKDINIGSIVKTKLKDGIITSKVESKENKHE